MKKIFILLCFIACVSCSVTIESAKKDPEQSKFVAAIQKDEVDISLKSIRRSSHLQRIDISGSAFAIRIRGDKAKANLPVLGSAALDGSETFPSFNVKNEEFICTRVATKNNGVIYRLQDMYGDMYYEVKVFCYYSGSALVVMEKNHAIESVYKFDGEIVIFDGPDF